MTKEERQIVFDKFGGRCAYCGCELKGRWHVDHVEAIFRNDTDEQFERRTTHGKIKSDLKRGADSIENMNPACPRCNGWKGTMEVETFRKEILEQVIRARKYSCNFRMAEDFGLIRQTYYDVTFYFEKHPAQTIPSQ